MKTTHKTKPLTIHIGKTGGVQVDADEFFAQPEVQKRQQVMRELNIAGKRLNGNKLEPSNTPSEKTPNNS